MGNKIDISIFRVFLGIYFFKSTNVLPLIIPILKLMLIEVFSVTIAKV